jgi:hypothetical protein
MTKNHVLAIVGIVILLLSLYLIEKLPIIKIIEKVFNTLIDEMMSFIKKILNPGEKKTLKDYNFIGFLFIFLTGVLICLFNFLHGEIENVLKLISVFIGIDIAETPKSPLDLYIFGSIFIVILMLVLLISVKICEFHERSLKDINL